MSIINLAGRFVSMFVGIFIAKILGPVSYGVLGIANLIIKYLGYFDLGALKCLTRNATIKVGENNIDEANKIKDVLFTFIFYATIIPCLILWIYFLFGFNIKDILNVEILFLITINLFTAKLYSYVNSLIKIEGNFDLIKKVQIIEKILQPLLLIVLAYFFLIQGILFSLFLNNIIKLGYVMYNFKIRLNFFYSYKKTIEQLKTSLQLYFNGFGESILISSGLLIATYFLSVFEVGIYTFAAGFISAKKIPFANPINIYIYREIFTNKNDFNNIESTPKLLNYPLTFYILFHSLIFGLIFLFYSAFIGVYLDEYELSISPMIFLFFGYIIYISTIFHKMILDANDFLNKILKGYVIGLLTLVFSILIFYYYKMLNVTNIAICSSLGFIAVTIYFNITSKKLIKRPLFKTIASLLRVIVSSSLVGIILILLRDYNLIETSMHIYLNEFLNLIVRFLIFTLSTYFVFFILFYDQSILKKSIELIKIVRKKNEVIK